MIFKKLLRVIKKLVRYSRIKYIEGHCIHFCAFCKYRSKCWYDLLNDE